jgi:hypothetical protein
LSRRRNWPGAFELPRQRSGLASACIAATCQSGAVLGVAMLGLTDSHMAATLLAALTTATTLVTRGR